MKQLAFFFDQGTCTGCHTCSIACADARAAGPGRDAGPGLSADRNFRRVWEVQGGAYEREGAAVVPRIYALWNTVACCHCREPACLAACPSGAIAKREADGLVLIDADLCVSCGACASACPYGAISAEPLDGKAAKCDFCAAEIEAGKDPVCVSACPMRALAWGDLEELRSRLGGSDAALGFPDPGLTRPALLVRGSGSSESGGA